MKIATAHLVSESAYSQSRHYSEDEVPALPKEGKDDYEKRTWRNRMTVLPNGNVGIPPMAFANCVKSSAKRLSIKVKGKGQMTYTKSFEAGVMVVEPLDLGVKPEDVKGQTLFVPSKGIRGAGQRVNRTFPLIPSWEGLVTFTILDDMITEDIFAQVLRNAGMLVGVGRFRPENCGYYGRFKVKSLKWEELEV